MRIVVAGLYNSGSSCVAGILHHLGVDMGAPFWEFPEKNEFFYEPKDLSAELRKMWREPDGETDMVPIARQRIFQNWVVGRETIDSRVHHGAKHPLLCLSLNDIASAWGDEMVCIWCRRDLRESIEKLKKRRWFSEEASESLQMKLYRSVDNFFRFSEGRKDRFVVDYEQIAVSDQSKLQHVDGFIRALNLHPTPAQRAMAIESIRDSRP